MTDKWEMCEAASYGLSFYSPGEPKRNMKLKEYLKSKGSQDGTVYDVLGYLLDDGWEPYQREYTGGVLCTFLEGS